MSKQANKTLIGGFVIGAVVIVVLGILIFGGGRLMTKKYFYVLFFDGSVKGLNVGAPVQLKGVTIGQIDDIRLLADTNTNQFYTKVIIEISPNKVTWAGQEEVDLSDADRKELMNMLIRKGLRAKLEFISFVTGQLQVSFDFYPDTEIRKTSLNEDFDELPTLPSDLEAITRKLEKLPFSELVEEALAAVEGINQLARSPKIQKLLASSDQTLQDIGAVAKRIDSQVVPVSTELRKTLHDTQRLVNNLNAKVVPVTDEIVVTLKSTSTMLDQLNTASTEIYQMLEEDSEFRQNLRNVLLETGAAAKSVRLLADYLEQHPEALLRGKQGGN